MSVFGLLQKLPWFPKGGHKKHLSLQPDFPFNVYKIVTNNNSIEQALLID